MSNKISVSWRSNLGLGRRKNLQNKVVYFASNGLHKMFFYIKMQLNLMWNLCVFSLESVIWCPNPLFRFSFKSRINIVVSQCLRATLGDKKRDNNDLEVRSLWKKLGSPPRLACWRKFSILPLLKRFKLPYLNAFNKF